MVKKPACQCRRCGFNPWVSKIPWRMEWQPIPVLLPRESHGQRSLVGYSPRGCKRVRHDLVTKQQNNRTYLVYLFYLEKLLCMGSQRVRQD